MRKAGALLLRCFFSSSGDDATPETLSMCHMSRWGKSRESDALFGEKTRAIISSGETTGTQDGSRASHEDRMSAHVHVCRSSGGHTRLKQTPPLCPPVMPAVCLVPVQAI